MYVSLDVCVYICVYTYIYIYIHMYIHMNNICVYIDQEVVEVRLLRRLANNKTYQ